MARPGVTKQEVITAIESLISIEAKVTVESVRLQLGKGSPNTINRHLRNWREEQKNTKTASKTKLKAYKIKIANLENELKQQTNQNQGLSAQLLELDRKNLKLESLTKFHEQIIAKQKVELQQFRASQQQTKEMYERVLDEKKAELAKILEQQNNQANRFREDLKTINEASLKKVREISIGSQDAWLDEKVKVKTAQENIKTLQSQLLALKQQLESAQKANTPLKKKITYQESLIANCLDPTKLANFTNDKEHA